jgi:hypothetical protein
MKVLDVTACTSIILAVISAPFFLFSCVPYFASRNRGPASRTASLSFSVFMLSVIVGLFAGWTGTSIARDEVVEKLKAAADGCQIYVNGKPARNPQEILAILRKMYWSPGHHSHPTTAININNAINVGVSYDSERIMLRVARDPDDPKEYWVFFPKYWITSTARSGELRLQRLIPTSVSEEPNASKELILT